MSLPPLPKIEGDYDIVMDVYTHQSVRHNTMNEEYGNIARLQQLGEHVLNLAVIQHYLDKRPMLSADEIAAQAASTLSVETVKSWIDGYGLLTKILFPPEEQIGPLEIRQFFDTFIGALYIRNGNSAVKEWISELIDPAEDSVPPPEPSANPIPPCAAPMQQSQLALQSGVNLINLALVNQVAAQQNMTCNYLTEKEGEAHMPTWTAQCIINGVERGRGTGKTQKIAKTAAARVAWASMGW